MEDERIYFERRWLDEVGGKKKAGKSGRGERKRKDDEQGEDCRRIPTFTQDERSGRMCWWARDTWVFAGSSWEFGVRVKGEVWPQGDGL